MMVGCKGPAEGNAPSDKTLTSGLSFSSKPEVLGWVDQDGSDSVVKFQVSNADQKLAKCRFYKKNDSPPSAFVDCGIIASSELRVSLKALAASMDDGTYILDVKLDKPDATTLSQELYMHSSINNATRCSLSDSDEAYFDKASEFLNMSETFGANTSLANPNINIEFSDLSTSQPSSLRRKFSLSSDRKLILVYRRFESKMRSGCGNFVLTGEKKSNRGFNKERIDCRVLAFNALGQGVCLDQSSDTISFVRYVKSVKNKFLASSDAGMFSQKTRDPASANDYRIYLPD